jgi:hypothetical protein
MFIQMLPHTYLIYMLNYLNMPTHICIYVHVKIYVILYTHNIHKKKLSYQSKIYTV